MSDLRTLSLDLAGFGRNLDAAADLIRSHRPDVALVQHAPEALRWRSKRAALARKSALIVATAHRPGGLLVMTTLAVSVHETLFSVHAGGGVSSADVTLSGARWCVVTTNLSLADAGPDEIAALPGTADAGAALVVAGRGCVHVGPGVTVTARELVGDGGLLVVLSR